VTRDVRLRRALRLLTSTVLVGGVYLLERKAPPGLQVGILYVIPVLLAAWFDGAWWGTAFACATATLRLIEAMNELPAPAAPSDPLVNAALYLGVVGIAIAGLSRLRRTQARLEQFATLDPLTGVLNARAFSTELAQELSRHRRYGRPLALIYLNLDDFKAVNDTRGRATGDAVLRLVSDAMRVAVRQADVIGRLGGDDFAVLMPETDGEVARAAATRLAAGIRTVFRGTPSVTASVGVVSVSRTEAGSDELLRRADQAMLEAKGAGKDRVVLVAI
jgi:diguanylate cyclase (GGDEF)-like protein